MVTQIRMMNCQSWKDASFSLSLDKLNVIEAPNSTGKSVLFKMLKITACPSYFDKAEREKLIRWNAAYASIIYAFDSGGAGAVKVYKERPIYFYKRAGGDWEQSLEPSPEMLAEIGLLADGDFIANIVDTDQDLLLVNPNLSSNYCLVKMLTYNEDLENLKERLAILQPKFRDYTSAAANKVGFYEKQLESVVFKDVVEMRQELAALCAAKNIMFQLIDGCNLLQGIKSVLQYYKNYEQLLWGTKLLQGLESIRLRDLAVGKEPLDERFAILLQKLESIRLTDLLVRHEPPDASIVVLLGECERLKMATSGLTKRTEWMLPLADLLREAETWRRSVAVMAEAGKRAEELEKQLRESADLVKCPIHGEVVYNGKECLPCGA